MNNNEEQNVQKDVVEKKCKIRAWYFVVLLVGIGFIMFASYNIGYKLGNVASQENNKKTEETNSNTNIDTNTSNSNVNNTNNENNTSNVTSNNTTNNTNVLSDAEALKLGNEKWEYAFSASWCEKYNYDDSDQYEGGVAITNFDEVNSHFSSDNIMDNRKSFKDGETENFNVKDGKYYDPSGCGRGSLITYSYTDLKLVSKTNTEIKFTATSTYCDPMRVNRGEKCSTKESVKVHDFIIKMENGEWKIARFTLPN